MDTNEFKWDPELARKVLTIVTKLIEKVQSGDPDRETALRYLNESEYAFLKLSGFFAFCENHGTLYIDGSNGYQLKGYMIEAGISDCAAVMEKLGPLLLEMEKLNEMQDELSGDEYDEKAEALNDKMEQIENSMPAESYEEIQVLLWRFALKHGLDKLVE